MNCFIGLVLVAGIYLNPCYIDNMKDYREFGGSKCSVSLNYRGGWVEVPAPCAAVQAAIEQAKATPPPTDYLNQPKKGN